MAKKNRFGVSIIEKEENFFQEFLEIGFMVILALTLFMTFNTYVSMKREVKGISMQPTYNNYQEYDERQVFDNVMITRVSKIRRGDVVVFDAPKMGKLLIKRVIAVGGDTLEFRTADGGAFLEVWLKDLKLNEYVKLNEPYINKYADGTPRFTKIGNKYHTGEEIKVPKGAYFVMGDNRDDSTDSRFTSVGFVPKQDIDGKVYLYVAKGQTFFTALGKKVFG